MLKTLLRKQRESLETFFQAIDIARAEIVLEKLFSCPGTIFLSGVGKSGHIAQKIAATFVSTGTRSVFLSPANALHGDIGIVSDRDMFLALSKSGESQELIDLIPYIRKKGAFVIACVSKIPSRLASLSDLSLLLPVEKEICPFDLAPTTSTAVQLLFGDCLAVALMQKKQFNLESFASNHPAGQLGRKIVLKVSDIMLRKEALPLCRKEDALIDVLHELTFKRCGCVLVCNAEKRLEGIFTDGDLRRALQTHGAEALSLSLERLMTPSPKTISSERLLIEAVCKMEEDPDRPVAVLPVIEAETVVGLVRMHDILQTGI